MGADFWLRGLAVFTATAIADVMWARYIPLSAMGRKHYIKAAFWGANIVLPGFVNMINGVEDHRMVVFAWLGAFVGTALTLRFSKEE